MATDPRRVESGTSYEAKGLIATPAEVLKEAGSSRGVAIRETVPEIANKRAAIQTYTRMVRSDAATRTSVRTGKVPVIGADYYIEPAEQEDEQAAVTEADFIDFNIFQGMTTPYLKVMEEMLRCYENGHAVGEKVFEIREWVPRIKGANRRKYTMLRKIATRPVGTIKNFEYDHNGS